MIFLPFPVGQKYRSIIGFFLFYRARARFVAIAKAGVHGVPRVREPKVRRLFAGAEWIRTCMGLFLSRVVLGLSSLLCSEREMSFFVPSPAIRVPGARGRGQGTQTLAKLGGLPPSGACVWQRLDA